LAHLVLSSLLNQNVRRIFPSNSLERREAGGTLGIAVIADIGKRQIW